MEIDLRDLIHDAILDREALNKRMLEGQIDVENELIDVITRRYEKERDQLIALAEAKRDALNEELTALDEQLAARKKLSEEEDKAKTLAEKEAQLARISADPTRKKEELKLRQEIADLREEMAWDIAEDEVDAQKKAIESQIESLDDYIEYVENYYEELLNNPRKLIEELKELLSQSDAEIIDWLTKNHEDYETATDATPRKHAPRLAGDAGRYARAHHHLLERGQRNHRWRRRRHHSVPEGQLSGLQGSRKAAGRRLCG